MRTPAAVHRKLDAMIAERADAKEGTNLAVALDVAASIARMMDVERRAQVEIAAPGGAFEVDRATLSQLVERHVNRRELGAYYTPDDVTAWVVAQTVRPLIPTLDTSAPADVRSAIERIRIVDPTCGSGAFLVAALTELGERHAACSALIDGDGGNSQRQASYRIVASHCLRGVDIVPEAVAMCALQLQLTVALVDPDGDGIEELHDVGATIRVADVLTGNAIESGSFDAVVGNPPFVTASSADLERLGYDRYATARCRNLSALTTERALGLLRSGGRLGLVLPVSVVCVDAMAPLRALLTAACDEIAFTNFDTIPSTLFEGVVQRLTIATGRTRPPRSTSLRLRTSRYHRWRARERPSLFASIEHVELDADAMDPGAPIPKIGTPVELDLLRTMSGHEPLGRLIAIEPNSAQRIHYKRRWSYHLFFADFVPEMYDADGRPRPPSELKSFDVVDGLDSGVVLAALASTTFFWWFTAMSDNRNVNRREIERFPFSRPEPDVARELAALSRRLMRELHHHSVLRECSYASVGRMTNRYFFQGRTKPVVDEIDCVLATHYGFAPEQTAFVLGFDAEFRGGTSTDARLRYRRAPTRSSAAAP